ncbi:hypothetical protein V8C35DRAFT_77163 [Trichoderma chlorosporum]
MSSTGGSQRASEVTSAMLNVPGYADDTMLFMLRWGSMAQATLRKVDYDEFLVRLTALNKHWFESQSESHSQSHIASSSSSSSSSSSRDSVGVVGTRGTGQGGGEPQTAAAAAEAEAAGSAEAAGRDDDDTVDGVHAQIGGDDAADPLQAAELKARTLELIQDFPQLVRDFDKFVDCTRIMAAKYGRTPGTR